MRRPKRVVLCLVPALLAIALAGQREPASGQNAEPEAAQKQPVTAKKFRGRLPNYFGQVVDEKQREEIYKIQAEFAPKIKDLRAQLAMLIKERNQKVDGVLTPQQRQKVEQLRAAAKAKRQEKTAPKAATEGQAGPG
jgi:Spy/CpxP family protein refolding chaperone